MLPLYYVVVSPVYPRLGRKLAVRESFAKLMLRNLKERSHNSSHLTSSNLIQTGFPSSRSLPHSNKFPHIRPFLHVSRSAHFRFRFPRRRPLSFRESHLDGGGADVDRKWRNRDVIDVM